MHTNYYRKIKHSHSFIKLFIVFKYNKWHLRLIVLNMYNTLVYMAMRSSIYVRKVEK